MKKALIAVVMFTMGQLTGCAYDQGGGEEESQTIAVQCQGGATCTGTANYCRDVCATSEAEGVFYEFGHETAFKTEDEVEVGCNGHTCTGSAAACAEFCNAT